MLGRLDDAGCVAPPRNSANYSSSSRLASAADPPPTLATDFGSGTLASRRLLPGVAVELAVERLAVEAEHLRRPRPVPADRLHHAQDVAPLDLLERDQLLRIVARDHHVRAAVVADALGQIVHPDALAGGQRHRALHAVLELADVPRPGVGEEPLRHRRREAAHRLRHLPGMMVDEAMREEEDVP